VGKMPVVEVGLVRLEDRERLWFVVQAETVLLLQLLGVVSHTQEEELEMDLQTLLAVVLEAGGQAMLFLLVVLVVHQIPEAEEEQDNNLQEQNRVETAEVGL